MAVQAEKEEDKDIKRVQIDALVVLQIMKHCRQHVPNPVTGMLLGLDVGDTMQVTHCFGYMTKGAEGEERSNEEGEQYQLEMLRRLREVNVDSNTVGWYQTTHLGQFFTSDTIETQYLYQTQIPRSALLIYDSLQAAIGKCAFKAFRLTKEFMTRHAEAIEQPQLLGDFPSDGMFEEIPVTVHSSLIVDSFLVDWALSDPISTTTQLDVLDLENQAFLEKNVQLLTDTLSELAEQQQKLQQWERQAAGKGGKGKGKPVHQPQPLNTMILSQRIQNHCRQINSFAGDSFGKLYLVANKPTGSQKQ